MFQISLLILEKYVVVLKYINACLLSIFIFKKGKEMKIDLVFLCISFNTIIHKPLERLLFKSHKSPHVERKSLWKRLETWILLNLHAEYLRLIDSKRFYGGPNSHIVLTKFLSLKSRFYITWQRGEFSHVIFKFLPMKKCTNILAT